MDRAEVFKAIKKAVQKGRKKLELRGVSELPPEIGKLTKLQMLVLNNNHLSILPPEISDLSNPRELNLSGNSLPDLPPSLEVSKNPAEIIAYYLKHDVDRQLKTVLRLFIPKN